MHNTKFFNQGDGGRAYATLEIFDVEVDNSPRLGLQIENEEGQYCDIQLDQEQWEHLKQLGDARFGTTTTAKWVNSG